jgi:hypothetical protein
MTTTLSRKYLQTLKTDMVVYDALRGISNEVTTLAMRGPGTRVVYKYITPYYGDKTVFGLTQRQVQMLFELLTEKFPDCDVDIKETTLLDGKTERGIVIDWS